MKLRHLAGFAAVALCAITSPSSAAILGSTLDLDVSSKAQSVVLPSDSSLIFDGNSSAFGGTIGVATTGTAEVFSVFGTPDLFETYATTSFPDEQLGSFQAYSSSTSIAYSAAAGILGFEFTQFDGVHYGLVDLGGSTISSFLYDTVAGESVPLDATGSAAPEPSLWALMLAGVAIIGLTLRVGRRQRGTAIAPQG